MCRMEDITDPEEIRNEPKCERNITLYGYVRGTHLRKNSSVHISGEFLFKWCGWSLRCLFLNYSRLWGLPVA